MTDRLAPCLRLPLPAQHELEVAPEAAPPFLISEQIEWPDVNVGEMDSSAVMELAFLIWRRHRRRDR